MYSALLVPTDGSDEAHAAAEHGFDLAQALDARVRLLSVMPTGPHGAMKRDNMRADPQAEAEEAIATAERSALERGLDVTTAIREGVPQEAIADEATESGVDAIVMGTVGRSGLDHVLLGSVTEEVVRNATVPVITVRPSS